MIEQFGRERPCPNARRIGFDDAEHVVQISRADAGTRARGGGDRIRRRDKRIRAVVDVEESPLGPLEQDALAAVSQVFENLRNVRRYRRDHFGRLQCAIERLGKVYGLCTEIVLQQEVVIVENFAEFRRKLLA